MSAPLRIHPTAIIDAGAELHETVEVGPYSIIGPGVTIGAGTWIGPHVVLRGPMTIGRDNKIFQFASLGEISANKALAAAPPRSEEHTSELQSLIRNAYAVLGLKQKT